MHFCNPREISVKIGNDKKAVYSFPENVGCIPLAVVIMTTANGMQPTFSGRHRQLFFIISDLYRVIMDFAEVQTDIVRSSLKSIRPLLP